METRPGDGRGLGRCGQLAYGGQAYVGSTGAGSVIQSSGVFSGFNLYIGNSVGGTGSYQLNGGTLSGTVLVGQQGTGLFVQTGSSTATMGVRLGGYATGSGHYLLQSGTLNIASGAVDLDIEANGLFEQTGGSYTGSYVDLGYGTGAVGATFRVTGGTQNIQGRVEVGANQQATVESLFQVGGTANLQASEVQVGLYGPGRYLQTGGQSNIGLLQVSRSANNSIADLQGGSLSAGTVLLGDQHYPTSVGVYRQSGGSLQVGAFSMSQGSRIEFANGQIATTRGLVCTGTFDFTAPGGTLDLAAGSSLDLSKASILHPGNGRINAQANTLVLLPAGFNLASLAGYASAGVTHLAGTTLEIPASQALTAMGNIDGYVKCLGSLKVGKSTDSLSVTKGVEVPAGGAMDMGAGSAVVETTTGGVSGGSLAGSGLTIGSAGTGRFTQSDGTTTMQYGIVLGEKAGSDGRLDLSGGAMTATAIFVGKAGNGHVVQTGGTLTGTANSSSYSDYSLVVAAPAGVTALYELGGSGSLNLYNATIGDYRGFGLFQQTGGAVTVNSHLGVGYGSGNGRYEMSGGTMNAGYLSVGEPQGTATSSRFVQTGGSITSSALTLYRGGSYLMSGTSGVHVTGDTEPRCSARKAAPARSTAT
ncbi:MAG: hypothetical protein NTV86_06370 [Planctomycetota bacterium]|nr:hypothetical protein [Planctomycetota bacterium]